MLAISTADARQFMVDRPCRLQLCHTKPFACMYYALLSSCALLCCLVLQLFRDPDSRSSCVCIDRCSTGGSSTASVHVHLRGTAATSLLALLLSRVDPVLLAVRVTWLLC